MHRHFLFTLVLAAAGGLLLGPNLGAGDKKAGDKNDTEKKTTDVVINGELINADLKDRARTESFCKTYSYKMARGRTYQIDLTSQAFDAFLRLEDPKGTQVAADDDSGGMLNARIIHRPNVTGDFTICATSLNGGSTGKFTLVVKDITNSLGIGPNDGKAIELKNDMGNAGVNSSMSANDPVYKGKKHKLFLFNMEAGKIYKIDMKSKAFDSFLILEDSQGRELASDDDSGGFPDAQIIFKAHATGKHRIIATHYALERKVGDFTLTIRQIDEKGK